MVAPEDREYQYGLPSAAVAQAQSEIRAAGWRLGSCGGAATEVPGRIQAGRVSAMPRPRPVIVRLDEGVGTRKHTALTREVGG